VLSCITPQWREKYIFAADRPLRGGRWPDGLLVAFEVDINTERADFLHQNIEGFRHTGVDDVVALDQVLVNLGAAVHVVLLHSQHLLQHIRCTIRFERPHFHLAESLAAELRLAA
jgi:hypothetical protein